MLITDRFVMLNFPKTGSSFARDVIKELHAPTRWQRAFGRFVRVDTGLQELLMVPYRFTPARHAYESQHGVYCQIPRQHSSKTVMSITRDPMARMVSAFEFKHWTRYQEARLPELRERWPAFPDLNFEEYVDFHHTWGLESALPPGVQPGIGPMSLNFIRFFAIDPMRTLHALCAGEDIVARRTEHFGPVRFLHMEDLRDELIAFLSEMGYDSERLAFIRSKPKVNTTGRSRSEYITPSIAQKVLKAERILYQLLPEYLPQPQTA